MNQVSQQNTPKYLQKDFYKPINNSNFEFEC